MKKFHLSTLLLTLVFGLMSCDDPMEKIVPDKDADFNASVDDFNEVEEPGQEIEVPTPGSEGGMLGFGAPMEFDYHDIDFRIEVIKDNSGVKSNYNKYHGEIPAAGGSFRLTHEYSNPYIVSGIYLNKDVSHSISRNEVSDNCFTLSYDWGFNECVSGQDLNTMTFAIDKNETGAPRNLEIVLRYMWWYADIYLTQESL